MPQTTEASQRKTWSLFLDCFQRKSPKEEPLFHPEGLWKGLKGSGINCRLFSELPHTSLIEASGTNMEHYLLLPNQSPESAAGAVHLHGQAGRIDFCLVQTPFSFTTQPLTRVLISAPAAWPSPMRPRTLDLGFLWTLSQRIISEWLPKAFPSMVPQGLHLNVGAVSKASRWRMGRTKGGYSCSE